MFRRALAVLAILSLTGASLVISSCRSEPSPGDAPGNSSQNPGQSGTGGNPGGPVAIGDGAATGLMAGDAVAVGPFTNLRSSGWTDSGLAWGWGDVSETEQIFFTVTADGTISSLELPVSFQIASATPLPDGRGFIGMHYSDMTGWFHPLEGEALSFGHVEGLLMAPAGGWVLAIAREGVVAYDTATWTPVHQPHILGGTFPFAGNSLKWIGDDLVAVRHWDRSRQGGELSRIDIVSPGDGQVRSVLGSAEGILSPLPSPDGRWVAVLAIESAQAVLEPEESYPTDAGRELRIYATESLASAADPEPVGVLAAGEGKVFSFFNWTPDGSRLLFAETTVSVVEPFGRPSLRYEPDGRIRSWSSGTAAGASGFSQLPLPAEGSWVPFGVSPGGRYLKVGDAISLDEFLWDLSAGEAVRLPQELDPGLRWFSDELAGTRLWDPDGRATPGVLVEIPAGRFEEVEWGRQIYTPALDGRRVAVKLPAGDAASGLEPFETLAEGDWLVVLPVR